MAQAAADSEDSSCISCYHSPARSIAFSRDLLQRWRVSREEEVDEKEAIGGERMGLNLGLSLGGYLDGGPKEEAPCSGNFQPRLQKLASGNMELRDGKEDGQASMVRNDREGDLPRLMTQIRHQPTAQVQQEMLEQQRRREMHALRRREARKKREEKQLKKAKREKGVAPIQACKVRNGSLAPLLPSFAPFPMRGSVAPFGIGMDSEKRLLQSQMCSIRRKDRAAKEKELTFGRDAKVSDEMYSQGIERQNSRTSPDHIETSPKGGEPSTSREFLHLSNPALPMPYPLPVLPGNSQCTPLPPGLPFPCQVPKGCHDPEAGTPSSCNVLQPIPTRALPPFQMPRTSLGGFADPWTRPQQPSHSPGASPGRSSSAVSESESRSSQGVTSNNSRSRSTASSALHNFSSASNSQDQTVGSSEVSASSELEPPCAEGAPEKVPVNTAQPSLEIHSTATRHETELADASSAIKPSQHQSALKATISNPDDLKASEGKLHDMPLVLTVCEGSNGKTVSGLLHSYSKDEVRIICMCHGTFLSPAEFVQHAGGTDLVHPERHIVVHPFRFRIPYTAEMS